MWLSTVSTCVVLIPVLALAQECSDSTSADVIFVLDGGTTGSPFISQQRNFAKFVARYLKVSVSPTAVGAVVVDTSPLAPVTSEIVSMTTNLTDFESSVDSLASTSNAQSSNLYIANAYTDVIKPQFDSGTNTANRHVVYLYSVAYTDVTQYVIAQTTSPITGLTQIGVNFQTRADFTTTLSYFAFSGNQLAALGKAVAASICGLITLDAPTVPSTTVTSSTSTVAATTTTDVTTTTAAATTTEATTTADATTTTAATTAAATTTEATTTAEATTTTAATTAAATTTEATTTAEATTTTAATTTAATTTAAITTTPDIGGQGSTSTAATTTSVTTTAAATTSTTAAETTTTVTTTTPGPAQQCGTGTYDGIVNTYNFYPGDCSKFYQCWRSLGVTKYQVRQCALGEVFSMTALDCISPNDVRVSCDVCPGSTSGRFEYTKSCSSYWFCNNGAATASCCPSNQRFDTSTSSCVSDTSCTTSCGLTAFSPSQFANRACRMTPTEDITSYKEEIFFGFAITRQCPMGTVFVPPLCQCGHLDTSSTATGGGSRQGGISCSPDTDLSFTSGMKDESPKNIFVAQSGQVTVSNGIAAFGGSGMLTVWRYASMDWMKGMAITMKVRPDSSSSGSQLLLTNCNCWSNPSFVASIAKRAGSMIYDISLEASINNAAMDKLTFSTTASGYIDITFRYDNTNLIGVVNGSEKSMSKSGSLSISNGALYIGRSDCPSKCGGHAGFTGSFDQIRIYKCGS